MLNQGIVPSPLQFFSLLNYNNMPGFCPSLCRVDISRMEEVIMSSPFGQSHQLQFCLQFFFYCTTISTPTAHLNLITPCLPRFRGHVAQNFSAQFILMLSKSLMQAITDIFNLFFLLLVGSGAAFFCLYFLLLTTQMISRGAYLDITKT